MKKSPASGWNQTTLPWESNLYSSHYTDYAILASKLGLKGTNSWQIMLVKCIMYFFLLSFMPYFQL